jgi:hypothetical protein
MRFTAIIQLMSDDVVYLKDSLYNTRYDLIKKDSYYYVRTFGETKNRNINEELEGELASLGCYPIDIQIYWGV